MSTPAPIPGQDEPLDALDERLLAELAGVFEQVDPVPDGLTDRVTFQLTLAGLHAEIAELQQTEALAVARDDRPVESMTFSGSRSSLMVTLTPGPGPDRDSPVRVDGWVTRGGTTVELVTAEEVIPRVADDRGRLVWEAVPHGMVHFVIRADRPDDPATLTPRVEI